MSLPDTASAVVAQVARRWRQIDPLLPAAGPAAPDCGTTLVVAEHDAAVAVGRCEHWTAEPGSVELSWGAARRFQLSAAVADPDVTGRLGRLLALWREHLAALPGTGDADTAAVVNWPSRDVDGIAALLRHGLDPLEVLAARTRPRRPPAGPPAEPRGGGVPRGGGPYRIRRAAPADTEVVARLGLEIIRFDSRFGNVGERPGTLAALRHEAAGLLAGPAPWTWLAEHDGEAVAMLAAQRPEAAGWVAPMTGLAPAAYLMLMFVRPGERGTGVAGALVDEFHRAADTAGVAVTLLHYAQLNPLSVPFWSRRGYRPLWTTWQATPAGAIS
jgi:GNAT superfamily N-acetyltransferase